MTDEGDRRSDKIEGLLLKIADNQTEQGLAIVRMEVSMDTILGRGCAVGQAELKEVRKELLAVDEKHDKRAMGVIGTAVLALFGALGSLYAMKIGR